MVKSIKAYKGQGKNDETIWWSNPNDDEIERTIAMECDRKQSFTYCKEIFDDKKTAFMRIFPPAIVGQIVIETNRKAERACTENNQANLPTLWKETDVDEIYAYITILLYSGAEKLHGVDTNDLFHKSNMPFIEQPCPICVFNS